MIQPTVGAPPACPSRVPPPRPHAPQVSALLALNRALPRVYRALTGAPSADAHASFSGGAQLFAEGVSLVVRPPGQRWRAFAALSGGQQALAALALSFALQVRWCADTACVALCVLCRPGHGSTVSSRVAAAEEQRPVPQLGAPHCAVRT